MKRTVLCILIALMICETTFAASKVKKDKQIKEKSEVVEDWYAYRFSVIENFRNPMSSPCKKAELSPAELAEARSARGINYQVIEVISRKNKPVVVDIQTTTVDKIGYDYNSYGTARSYRTQKQVITDRFVRGETYCDEIRNADLSGEFDKQKLDRYR